MFSRVCDSRFNSYRFTPLNYHVNIQSNNFVNNCVLEFALLECSDINASSVIDSQTDICNVLTLALEFKIGIHH